MATVLDRTVQALADVSGIIVDRTVTPEKIIGQGWIISKSRMVVLASCVANYADAPWALLVKFPYPDLVFSVKAISLHPEFNRRTVREHYLAQANELLQAPLIMENDIATITIEADIPDLQPDRVQELNRALSLPLTISAQDLSGVMRAGDTGNILQKAITSQRNGVLNFYDERKIPFCRVLIKGSRIVKASFQNLQNEFAVCELMWRKPGGNFVLQSNDNLSWANVPDIQMSTQDLAKEATRRNQDLPRMLDALGGPNVRYVRTRQQMDINQINQQIRWVVERIWPALDGALSLTKLSDRVGVDTYTALQALWEMKHLGLVAMANFEQYHRSGQLGPALVPGHDVDLKFWDNLQGFFLDDLSTLPMTIQGNFFGSTHLLSQANLLHTMPVQSKYGAVILKDGRLVGLHNGKFTANLQNPPPFPLYQMAWIGTLSDMGAKRMRAATSEIDADLAPEAMSGRATMTGLKARPDLASTSAPEQQLPVKPVISDEPEILQKFTKIQMGAAGGAIGLLFGMILACVTMAPKSPVAVPPPQNNTATSSTGTSTGSADTGTADKGPPTSQAFKATLKLANVKETPPPLYRYTDTSKETSPRPSFGLESEQQNQKIYFVVWPNPSTANAVESNMKQPPYVPVKAEEHVPPLKEGNSPLRNFTWKATRYMNNSDKPTVVFLGAFSSSQGDKSILVVAVPFKGEGELDFNNTTNTVERTLNDNGSASSGANGEGATTASDADVQAYRQKIADIIKPGFKAPPDADRTASKCMVNFTIDGAGAISKLELKYSSGMDEVDKAVQKAITSKVPFPAPPNTKTGQVEMQATVDAGGSDLSIGEP